MGTDSVQDQFLDMLHQPDAYDYKDYLKFIIELVRNNRFTELQYIGGAFKNSHTYPGKLALCRNVIKEFDPIKYAEEITVLLMGMFYPLINEYDRVDSERKSTIENVMGAYTYIPADRTRFIQYVSKIIKKSQLSDMKFIDVGCGIGDKVMLAQFLGFDAYGIEINSHTLGLAQYFLHKVVPYTHLILGNAFDIDYSQYSFIYMYVPIYDVKKMAELYRLIKKRAKGKTVIFDIARNPRYWYKYHSKVTSLTIPSIYP